MQHQDDKKGTDSDNGNVTVPIKGAAIITIGGSLTARATSIREFYEERPIWRIAAVALIPFGAFVGYAAGGE